MILEPSHQRTRRLFTTLIWCVELFQALFSICPLLLTHFLSPLCANALEGWKRRPLHARRQLNYGSAKLNMHLRGHTDTVPDGTVIQQSCPKRPNLRKTVTVHRSNRAGLKTAGKRGVSSSWRLLRRPPSLPLPTKALRAEGLGFIPILREEIATEVTQQQRNGVIAELAADIRGESTDICTRIMKSEARPPFSDNQLSSLLGSNKESFSARRQRWILGLVLCSER